MEKCIQIMEQGLPPELCDQVVQGFEHKFGSTVSTSETICFSKNNEPLPHARIFRAGLKDILQTSVNHYMEQTAMQEEFSQCVEQHNADIFLNSCTILKITTNPALIPVLKTNACPRGFLTFYMFLNDVDEGGELEFANHYTIRPKKGQLILFPTTWVYAYKQNIPVTNAGYVVSGFVYRKTSMNAKRPSCTSKRI